MAGFHVFSITDRMFFACYTLMYYFLHFLVPYPLSTFHPFPPSNDLGWPVLISPLFVVALIAALWFLRKHKFVVFGLLFYIINLLLVLQVISIGLTIVSERYTYMPYIGIAFIIATGLTKIKILPIRYAWAISGVFFIIPGAMTFQRADVWKNSGTLWSDVIETYPNTPYPRSNRANYLSILASKQTDKRASDSLNRLALEDCNIAIALKPNHAPGYEKRALIYIGLGMPDQALADADSLVKYAPGNKIGYDVRGTVYFGRREPQKAMENYNKCIEINPEDHRSYSNRGVIYMNFYQQYPQAIVEFNKAISIYPLGSYLLNRSICYYRMGNLVKAREDAQAAIQKGTVVQDSYRSSIQLK
jgi:tetratricopeptide (TPR) repeat protein